MQISSPTLLQLYSEHAGKVSDKWTRYLAEYDVLLERLRLDPLKMLEIGVQNGGGLEIWAKYFPHAQTILGCDIDPQCASLRFEDPRIRLVIGDANAADVRAQILASVPSFDLIIDDGSHTSADVIRSFLGYFPALADGSLYVVEDLHTSYWQEFGGGLFHPHSSLSFFKALVDMVNQEHWGVGRRSQDLLEGFCKQYGTDVDTETLAHIHSIRFINSMCVIEKALPASNRLGGRFVAGKTAAVFTEVQAQAGSPLQVLPQDANPWANCFRPLSEELYEKEQQVESLQARLDQADEKVRLLTREVSEVYASTSWRVTAPLRKLKDLLSAWCGKG